MTNKKMLTITGYKNIHADIVNLLEESPGFSVFQWLFNFKFILSSSWIKLCSAVRSDPEEREARLEG